MARLFLAADWQSTSAGREEGFGLLFPMNDLFEAFVGRSMQHALVRRDVRLQHRGSYALESGGAGLFALVWNMRNLLIFRPCNVPSETAGRCDAPVWHA